MPRDATSTARLHGPGRSPSSFSRDPSSPEISSKCLTAHLNASAGPGSQAALSLPPRLHLCTAGGCPRGCPLHHRSPAHLATGTAGPAMPTAPRVKTTRALAACWWAQQLARVCTKHPDLLPVHQHHGSQTVPPVSCAPPMSLGRGAGWLLYTSEKNTQTLPEPRLEPGAPAILLLLRLPWG